jgi:hypothetical protein
VTIAKRGADLRTWLQQTLACALLAAACCTFAAEDIRIVERRTITPVPVLHEATHMLRLHIFRFTETSWRAEDIEKALPRAAGLLTQCAIAIESIDLAVLETPPRFRYYRTPVSRALLRALEVRKPALFFVEDTRNVPAFDAEAIGLSNAGSRPELANTVWVAHGARDPPYAIAHELVHVLADSGEHSSVPGNLMRDETSAENTALTAEQCARVRSRGEANGLLARVR